MNNLVLDFGGTNLKYAIMNSQCEFIEKGKLPSPTGSKDAFFESIDFLYHKYKHLIRGIAISMAGRISSEKGYIYHGGAYQLISEVNIVEILSKKYHCKVSVINDANAALLAEMKLGSLKNDNHALAIIIGTGIGASLMLNRKLIWGGQCNVGELSGVLLNSDDISIYQTMCAKNSTRTLIQNYCQQKGITDTDMDGISFFEKVAQNDEMAINILQQFCQNLAITIYNFQSLLDVDKVIIGGGISQNEAFIATLKEAVCDIFEKQSRFHIFEPEIAACQFYNDANLIGAQLFWLNH